MRKLNKKRVYLRSLNFILIIGLIIGIGFCMDIGDSTYEELEPDDLPQSPTYSAHIAPIMEIYCNDCHRMDNYDTVRRRWRGIKRTAIERKTMPTGGKDRVTPRDAAIMLRWEKNGFQQN